MISSFIHSFFFHFFFQKVLSDEMLYMMTAQPGDDMGNVVAWKDFEKPASIPNEEFRIYRNFQNFRVSSSKCSKRNQAVFWFSYNTTGFLEKVKL
jgi:hypothetical protein